MRYPMNLCKVYDLSQSSFAGHEVFERVHQSDAMSDGIKLFSNNGIKSGVAKSIMRVLLLGAFCLPFEALTRASIAPLLPLLSMSRRCA